VSTAGHSVAGSIMSLKNPNYPTRIRNWDLVACSAVPQLIAQQRITGIRSFGLLEIQAKSLISEDTIYTVQSPEDKPHLCETGRLLYVKACICRGRMMTDAICQILVSHR